MRAARQHAYTDDVGDAFTIEDVERPAVEAPDDVIADFVGSDDTLTYSLSLLGTGGDHHVVGYEETLGIPAQAVVGMEIDFRGTLVGTYVELEELIALAEADESARAGARAF